MDWVIIIIAEIQMQNQKVHGVILLILQKDGTIVILKIVVIKLIAPKIDEAPAKCKLKIAKSTDGPECACTLDNGG